MVSVFEKHKEEIGMYEKMLGKEKGHLMFALSILSDVQAELTPNIRDRRLNEEINEAKELIIEVFKSKKLKRLEEVV